MFTHLAATCTATRLPNSTQPTLPHQTSLTPHLVTGQHNSPQHTPQQAYPPHMDLTFDMPTCFSQHVSSHTHTLPRRALPHAYSLLPNLCLHPYLPCHSPPHHKPTCHPFTDPPVLSITPSIHLATLPCTKPPHHMPTCLAEPIQPSPTHLSQSAAPNSYPIHSKSPI